MLSTGFFNDAKIRMLPIGGKHLYLGLLLCCGDVASNSVECSRDVLVNLAGGRGHVVEKLLDDMVSLQLLTYEKKTPIEYKRIEKKIIEEKRITKNKNHSPPIESAAPVIGVYCDLWRDRYKTESHPVILKKEAGMIKNFVKSVGQKKAIEIITTYLEMPDHWFVTKRHDIPTMMANLNSITQFMETGKMFTRGEIRNLDVSVVNQQTIDALRKGEI